MPGDVRTAFVTLLLKNGHKGCMLGAALMYCAGLRTSEAAAPDIGDIVNYGNYGTLNVLTQNLDGERSDTLKTKSAYRVVVVSKIMLDLIEARKSYLYKLGYRESEVTNMPCVAMDDDPTQRATSEELSAYAKAALIASGCAEQYISSAARMNSRESGNDGLGSGRDSVAAYVLRRDWCSRACNVCGMPMEMVDYIIGHANKDNRGDNYLTPEKQKEIAKMLERHVTIPAYSLHPAHFPHRLKPGDDDTIMGYTIHNFCAEKDVEVTLDLVCLEPDDAIWVTAPQNANVVATRQKDTPERRSVRSPIGEIYNST